MKKRGESKNLKSISRRSFLNKAAAGTAVFAIGQASWMSWSDDEMQNVKWDKDAKNFRFHLIGQAHIDPVWLWPWPEGMAIVHSTFRSALDRMNETPDFTFTASSAQFYEWVAENDPAMISEIRKRIDEGRWNIVGGWWVEPDMNMPCGEAMVRQGLYGQLTFEKLFGRRATVAFNPDSFGHTGTLPQIIRSQGMENYVFMRPGLKEKSIPSDLFWWEGPDGSRVLTYRIPISYNDNRSVRGRIEQVLAQMKGQPFRSFMTFYGAGDHGGGATKENISSIKEIQSEKDAPVIFFSTPEKYFAEIRDIKNENLPVIKDDLQHHAVGCYTAESEIKKGNRAAESALITAEKIASIGSVVWNFVYPGVDLENAWKRILFLQFHDSLAGTSLPEHSQTAREGYGYALDTANQTMFKALQKLEWMIQSEDPASLYILAFNPHAWEITGMLEYDLNWDISKQSVVEDEKGNQLAHQWCAGSTETGSRKKLLIKATLPSFGYKQIRIRVGEKTDVIETLSFSDNSIENEFFRIVLSQAGPVSIHDKVSGWEVFKDGEKGFRAVVLEDTSDTWSHDIKAFENEKGVFGDPEISIIEKGPLRIIARVRTKYNNSTLTTDWILCAGIPYIETRITLNWNEHLKMLKFSFPVNVENPAATYEVPYGYIVRPVNGWEEPGLRWIDVSGISSGETFGLTIINDAKYGYSVKENDLRISAARSAVYAHHNPRVLDMKAEHHWQDQGIQTFRMLLVPHKSSWQNVQIPRIAEEFISSPLLIFQGIHGGKMSKAGSFLGVDAKNVIITSIKLAESHDDLIIRCVETAGQITTANISLKFAGLNWESSFRPCEIKSLRVNCKTGKIVEVNLLEEQIK